MPDFIVIGVEMWAYGPKICNFWYWYLMILTKVGMGEWHKIKPILEHWVHKIQHTAIQAVLLVM